jgi:hypothetical protein
MSHDFRLLEYLLRHEVAVRTFVDQAGRYRGRLHLAVHRPLVRVVDRDTVSPHDGQIAVLKVRDLVRQRREREGIGAQVHLFVAKADRKRRPAARADH